MKNKNICKPWLLSILFAISLSCLFLNMGCESILPDEYKEKKFDSPAIDAYACSMLSKQVYDSSVVLITGRSLSRFSTFIPQQELDTLSANQVIKKYYSQLLDSLPALGTDSLIFLEYAKSPAKAPQNVYAKIVATGGKQEYVFYISLQYYISSNGRNTHEYVLPDIIKSDTSLVPCDNSMSNESISSCTQFVSSAQGSEKVFTIKGRFKFNLSPGTYLVRFYLSNPAMMAPATGLLYFKLLIL